MLQDNKEKITQKQNVGMTDNKNRTDNRANAVANAVANAGASAVNTPNANNTRTNAPNRPNKANAARPRTAMNGVQKKKETENSAAVAEIQKQSGGEVVRVRSGIDRIFFITVLLLVCFGSVMVFSAGYAYSEDMYGDNFYLIKRQLGFAFIGLLGMLLAMNMRYDIFKKFTWWLYGVTAVLLLLVMVIGRSGGGAQRWLVIPGVGISFQPSEIAKLAVVFVLAWYVSKYSDVITDYKNFKNSFVFGTVVPYCIIGVLCLLVVLEKHFSGLIILVMIGTAVLFVGGSRFRYIAGIGAGAAAVIAVAIVSMGYSMDRITAWLDPEANYLDGGWQTVNGMNAIGSGGLFGIGLGNSRLKYGYVSMPHNDFIYTIVCEELGFIGALAVIALFAILIWRGFVIAMKAPDKFSSLVVVGIISKVAIQVIFNIAVVTNLIPNTGISLPFFSYGGTSLVILMTEMGIILSISKHSYQRK